MIVTTHDMIPSMLTIGIRSNALQNICKIDYTTHCPCSRCITRTRWASYVQGGR